MLSGTAKTFSLHVRCRYGDHDDWITMQSRVESLEQLLAAPCGFECPTHGAQLEFPLEGVEKRSAASRVSGSVLTNPESKTTQKRFPLFSPGKTAKPSRSSERKAFCVPVIVYGWSKSFGTFHENTTTLMFNASGALVRLVTPVEIGENLFIVNKFTKDELEARVVFKATHYKGGFDVGLAFAKPASHFWRKTRRGTRAPQTLRVIVRGKDRNGNPFSQSSYTMDISEEGARLDNVAYLTSPGQVIEVRRRWHGKARFRVAWIGQLGTSESNQIGICTLDSGKLPWRIKFVTPPPSKSQKKS
jgi:hypothetical protein